MKKKILKFVLPLFVIGCFSFISNDSNHISSVGQLDKPVMSSSEKLFQPQTVTIFVTYDDGAKANFSSHGCTFISAYSCAYSKAIASRPGVGLTVNNFVVYLLPGQCA